MLPILVGVVLVLVAWQAVRKPVLRRLALRDAARRPMETLLVIGGSLLGTALITGSFIVGDTLDSSIKQTAYTQLGPVDEVVGFSDAEAAAEVESALVALDDPRIDGVASMKAVQAAFLAHASSERLAEPEGQLIELDFPSASTFGGDPEATGIEGATPSPGEVYLSDDLAERLGLEPGDRVTTFVYGRELILEVGKVLERVGLAGFWMGQQSTSQNGFVAPGTIPSPSASAIKRGAAPPLTSVLISNRGGVEEGARLSEEVADLVDDVLPAGTQARAEPVKRMRLDAADAQGDEFGELFLSIGSFAIVAGVLLLVNIFVMLAEERKSQLGMLRAIGMRQSHLVRAFVIEGTMYALAAAAVGTVVGIGVGWAIARLAAPIFGGFDDFALELRFAIDRESLMIGFCVGFLISVLTIVGTSYRISRVNIIRAIRELPEPTGYITRRRTVVVGAVVAVVSGIWGVASFGSVDGWFGALVAPVLAVFGLLPFLSMLMARRVAVIMVSSFGLAWGLFADALGAGFFEAGEIFAFVVMGVLVTFCAVVLLSQMQETFGAIVRRIAARNLPVRLSVAYPLARRVRTALTLGMFALVIFTMTMISVLSTVFGGQIQTAIAKEGGFEVLATASSTNPPDPETIAAQDGVEAVASLLFGNALWTTPAEEEPQPWPVSGVDEEFVGGGPPLLSDLAEGISSDEEAWDRLVSDPSTAIVPSWFLQEGGGPPTNMQILGKEITMMDPFTGKEVSRTVIAHVENDYAFSGVYMSKAALREGLGPQASRSRFYIEVSEGADPDRVAVELQGDLVANGLEADSFATMIEDFQASNLQFFQLMQAYLALGLLVGIAGLGVVMIRAVRDRRREVGVLRSLGFVPGQVRRAFVLESGFVALEGIVVGACLGLVTAAQLIATDQFGEGLTLDIPWTQLTVVAVTALLASLLATAWPAQQASRIAPAVALRIAD